KVAQMTATKIPARSVALSMSAAVHVVAITGVLALWPARPEHAPVARGAHAASNQRQTSTSPLRAPTKDVLGTAQVASPTVAVSEARALVPMMVDGVAAHTVGERVLNHLWQSTLFAFLVGCLALAFRKNDARIRYWIWFAASVKFLVPFSLLDRAGASL